MKRILVVMVVALCFVMFSGLRAEAANAWYMCTVAFTGPTGTAPQTVAWLTDNGGSFTKQSFVFRSGREKEMLAVALTALVNNLTVKVYCDPALTNLLDRIIQNMYLETP